MSISIEISYGELIDKISILEIKSARITDPEKLKNIETELDLLAKTWRQADCDHAAITTEQRLLKSTNEELWEIEDAIRLKEAAAEFDAEFISLARSVYRINDRRADHKRAINERLGSHLIEEKSYQRY